MQEDNSDTDSVTCVQNQIVKTSRTFPSTMPMTNLNFLRFKPLTEVDMAESSVIEQKSPKKLVKDTRLIQVHIKPICTRQFTGSEIKDLKQTRKGKTQVLVRKKKSQNQKKKGYTKFLDRKQNRLKQLKHKNRQVQSCKTKRPNKLQKVTSKVLDLKKRSKKPSILPPLKPLVIKEKQQESFPTETTEQESTTTEFQANYNIITATTAMYTNTQKPNRKTPGNEEEFLAHGRRAFLKEDSEFIISNLGFLIHDPPITQSRIADILSGSERGRVFIHKYRTLYGDKFLKKVADRIQTERKRLKRSISKCE